MKKLSKLEAILWNVALPGFSQLLAGDYIKGLLFVALEFIINVKSHFNLGILYSFVGKMDRSYATMDFQWLMFYPCVYMFAIWDAYRYAMPPDEKLSFLPFVFAAYSVTIGIMYSKEINLFGINLGPVFLPMLFLVPGIFIGLLVRHILIKKSFQK
ncbi:MAG: hypothetical protein Q8906_01430 [Bacillota bacterium]|nr:hypothetical protein [Bacillota bacterium]MDP4169237.1 hypothetical protein [Bacillota bacterium]